MPIAPSAANEMVHLLSENPFDADLLKARRVLAEYGNDLQQADIEHPARARGFSGALILRVQIDGTAYCLRRWPEKGLPDSRLNELHHFLQHMHNCGIAQVPVPLSSQTGASLPLIDGERWQLEPWLPGTADFHQSPNEPRLRSAMTVLARLHRAAELYDCRSSGREWFARHSMANSPACRERLEIIHRWSDARCDDTNRKLRGEPDTGFRAVSSDILRLYRLVRTTIEAELVAAQIVRYPLHPCLRDVWHDHLLFTGDELTGLVDPAATRYENVAADLSRLLGSLLGDNRPQWDLALDAYSAIRPLSVDERRLVIVLDRSSVLLSGLTWIDRRLHGQLAEEDLPRIVRRLQTIAGRLSRLA